MGLRVSAGSSPEYRGGPADLSLAAPIRTPLGQNVSTFFHRETEELGVFQLISLSEIVLLGLSFLSFLTTSRVVWMFLLCFLVFFCPSGVQAFQVPVKRRKTSDEAPGCFSSSQPFGPLVAQ